MNYDEFEKIGMDVEVPYALCKLAWEWKPRADMPLIPEAVAMMFLNAMAVMPPQVLKVLQKVSSEEIEPGALEQIAKEWLEKMKPNAD